MGYPVDNKLVYLYDNTFRYTSEYTAQRNPKNKNTFLQPVNSTEIKPDFKDGFTPYWSGTGWENRPVIKEIEVAKPSPLIFISDIKKIMGGVISANTLFGVFPVLLFDIQFNNYSDLKLVLNEAVTLGALTHEEYTLIIESANKNNIPIN